MNSFDFYFLRNKKKILKNQSLVVLTLDTDNTSLPEPKRQTVSFHQLMSFAISLGQDYTVEFGRRNRNGDINADIICEGTTVYKIKMFPQLSTAKIRLMKKDEIPNASIPNGYQIDAKYTFHQIKRNVSHAEEQEMIQKQTLYNKLGQKSAAVLIGQKIFKLESRDQLLMDSMARLCYRRDPRRSQEDPFCFTKEYPGHWEFHTTDNPLQGLKIGDLNIHSFTYLVDEFRDIIARAQCIELDASFYVMHPLVFTMPLAIVANESIPLGLSVGPTESSMLYQQFYTFIQSVDADACQKLKAIPVLSDEGLALKKFCEDNSITQFLCFTHLIRKFGASTKLGGIVKGLLFQKSPEDFKRVWKLWNPQIVDLLNNNQKHIKQFEQLFECSFTNGKLSEPNFHKQAIWERARFSIPTTTNHAESTHSHVNFMARKVRLPSNCITVLLHYIRQRFEKIIKRPNLRKSINILKSRAKDQGIAPSGGQQIRCNCRKNAYKKALYMLESEFPCKHCVDSFLIPEMEPFKADPHPQSEPTFREVNDDEKEWKSGQKQVCSRIPFTEADMLMYQALGRPDYEIIENTCQAMPNNPLSNNPKAMQGYIEMLFVHYCGHLIGKYEYSDEFIGLFIRYASSMVLHEDPKLANPSDPQERERLISTYHATTRTATEEELNSEYFESLEENNEFKNSHSGDIHIEDEDLQDLFKLISEKENEELIEDEDQEGEKEHQDEASNESEEEDQDEASNESEEEHTTMNEVSDVFDMLQAKTQNIHSIPDLLDKIVDVAKKAKKKIKKSK